MGIKLWVEIALEIWQEIKNPGASKRKTDMLDSRTMIDDTIVV